MTGDCSEDDEPIDKIESDFASGEQGWTGRPVSNGRTVYLALSGVVPAESNLPSGEQLVRR